jgi:hypothetical protein
VFGGRELDQLNLQKQALLLESGLNRVALQAEVRSLRSATAWVREAGNASRELSPLLLFLAPVGGFLLAWGARRPIFRFSAVMAAAKWIGPLYGLWKSFSSGRTQAKAGKATA